MSGWTYGPSEAYAVQVLARHQMVERVLADVAQDMQICRIEGWDVWEYPRMLLEAIPTPPTEGALDDVEPDGFCAWGEPREGDA